MGLFSKKDGYDARQRELEEEVETAADRIIFDQIEDDDQHAADLVDEMKMGKPLVINLENLQEVSLVLL